MITLITGESRSGKTAIASALALYAKKMPSAPEVFHFELDVILSSTDPESDIKVLKEMVEEHDGDTVFCTRAGAGLDDIWDGLGMKPDRVIEIRPFER